MLNSVSVFANDIQAVLLVMDEAQQKTFGLSVLPDRHLFHVFDKAVVVEDVVLVAIPQGADEWNGIQGFGKRNFVSERRKSAFEIRGFEFLCYQGRANYERGECL